MRLPSFTTCARSRITAEKKSVRYVFENRFGRLVLLYRARNSPWLTCRHVTRRLERDVLAAGFEVVRVPNHVENMKIPDLQVCGTPEVGGFCY